MHISPSAPNTFCTLHLSPLHCFAFQDTTRVNDGGCGFLGWLPKRQKETRSSEWRARKDQWRRFFETNGTFLASNDPSFGGFSRVPSSFQSHSTSPFPIVFEDDKWIVLTTFCETEWKKLEGKQSSKLPDVEWIKWKTLWDLFCLFSSLTSFAFSVSTALLLITILQWGWLRWYLIYFRPPFFPSSQREDIFCLEIGNRWTDIGGMVLCMTFAALCASITCEVRLEERMELTFSSLVMMTKMSFMTTVLLFPPSIIKQVFVCGLWELPSFLFSFSSYYITKSIHPSELTNFLVSASFYQGMILALLDTFCSHISLSFPLLRRGKKKDWIVAEDDEGWKRENKWRRRGSHADQTNHVQRLFVFPRQLLTGGKVLWDESSS